jgi:hypothetical protein
MAQFEVALLNDKLVAPSTRELMWTPLKTADGNEVSCLNLRLRLRFRAVAADFI